MDGNKVTSNVAYDSIAYSLDSLSFSGLVSSIQNHQPKAPSSPNRVEHYLVSKHDREFEFTSTKTWILLSVQSRSLQQTNLFPMVNFDHKHSLSKQIRFWSQIHPAPRARYKQPIAVVRSHAVKQAAIWNVMNITKQESI